MKRLLPFFALVGLAFAQEKPAVLDLLAQQLAKAEPAAQKNILRGMAAALKGRRGVSAPANWDTLAKQLSTSPDQEIRDLTQSLGTTFGSKDAFAALRKTAADSTANNATRLAAIEALVGGKDDQSPPLLKQLIAQPGPLRGAAIRGLAAFSENDTIETLMAVYEKLTPEERRDALNTIASRLNWARALIYQLDSGRLPKTDISVTVARQLRSFKNADLDAALERHIGKINESSADKQAAIAKMKVWLTPDYVKAGDPKKGRLLFSQTCALCHKLFDAGADIGPELTGANRTDIDYLLQNIIDPNALIGADYQFTTVELKDGRILAGLIRNDNTNTLSVRTMTETVTVPVGDVKTRTVNPISMMPEGLITSQPQEAVRDLFRYLGGAQQVPLP